MSDSSRDNSALFINFIMSLAQSGMMQLGKLMNPMTGKTEKDLDGARGTIDLLMMLRVKTEGNLSKEESAILTSSISSLQMNYVEESSQPADDADAASEGQQETPADDAPADDAPADENAAEADTDTPD